MVGGKIGGKIGRIMVLIVGYTSLFQRCQVKFILSTLRVPFVHVDQFGIFSLSRIKQATIDIIIVEAEIT